MVSEVWKALKFCGVDPVQYRAGGNSNFMLFKSFTWQHFLVAAILLSCLWYFTILPLLYRKQIRVWLDQKDKKKGVEPLRKTWDEETEPEPELVAENELLGKSKLPAGVERVSMDAFGFADVDDGGRELQQGLVPDAIEELKTIFHILETEGGGKADFISLFGLVKSKYADLRGTPSGHALNDFIRENALFPISDEELTHLWQ